MDVDVAVIGAGPAGATLALTLASRYSVLLVDQDQGDAATPLPTAMGLVPAVRPLLEELRLLRDVERGADGTWLGRASWWANEEPTVRDFLADPNGTGWTIDRPWFDQLLRTRAVANGAKLLASTRVVRLLEEESGWHLELETGSDRVPVRARILVDATGSKADIAQQLFMEQQRFDGMRTYWLSGVVRDPDVWRGYTLTESCRVGWWHSAPIGAGRKRVLIFHGDEAAANDWTAADLYAEAVGLPGIGAALHAMRFRPAPSIRSTESPGAALRCCAGRRWLAIGDAAVTYDPLAGQGLSHALQSGRDGAVACHQWLEGNTLALADYGDNLHRQLEQWLKRRRALYGAECRWPEAPFWSGRHTVRAGDRPQAAA